MSTLRSDKWPWAKKKQNNLHRIKQCRLCVCLYVAREMIAQFIIYLSDWLYIFWLFAARMPEASRYQVRQRGNIDTRTPVYKRPIDEKKRGKGSLQRPSPLAPLIKAGCALLLRVLTLQPPVGLPLWRARARAFQLLSSPTADFSNVFQQQHHQEQQAQQG